MSTAADEHVGTELPRPHDHLVTFYESDEFLVESVVDFLAPAIGDGRPTLAVATREHLDAIEDGLRARGLEPSAPGFVGLDAQETLRRCSIDGRIDGAAFAETIGALMDAASGGVGTVRVFGEMVALLWEQGDIAGAVALEDMWNELATSRAFVLSCAYPMRSFEREEDAASFQEVCSKHSAVTPSESFMRLDGADEQLRHVASLQQEAAAGAHERLVLRRKQEELESALAQLRELDRLRSEFVAMVVHDIRSPAGVISGFLDLLLENWNDVDERDAREFLSTALGNSRRIERLVDDILTMSRIDSGEFSFELRPADVGRIVESTAREVSESSGRPIEVERPDGLRAALVDEDRQVQILTNLLSNAVKFSPDGSPIRVWIEDHGDQLTVNVRDEGIGISPREMERLFRPFSRLDSSGRSQPRGTGLGLYISKALVEGQGGSISVHSVEGSGSTFTYTLLPATPHR